MEAAVGMPKATFSDFGRILLLYLAFLRAGLGGVNEALF